MIYSISSVLMQALISMHAFSVILNAVLVLIVLLESIDLILSMFDTIIGISIIIKNINSIINNKFQYDMLKLS